MLATDKTGKESEGDFLISGSSLLGESRDDIAPALLEPLHTVVLWCKMPKQSNKYTWQVLKSKNAESEMGFRWDCLSLNNPSLIFMRWKHISDVSERNQVLECGGVEEVGGL